MGDPQEAGPADVRPHAWTAAALLALGALVWPLVPSTLALLGGATLALQTIVLWYLPSFAKRALVGPAWVAQGGVVLFPLAAVVAPLHFDIAWGIAAFGQIHFAAYALVSATQGRPWRGGVPFWRTGAHVNGDRAAAAAIVVGLLVLALVTWVPGPPATAWLTGLGITTAGALAHIVPRARGRAPIPALVIAGALVTAASFVPRAPPGLAAGGLLLMGAGILAGRATKTPGARLRDAIVPLSGALLAMAAALVGAPLTFAAATGLALFGLALMTLPVAFNQRPRAALVGPATLLALASPAAWVVHPIAGLSCGSLAILAAIGALEPLRRPRRVCPPDEAS